jgi:hypothetical protein
MSGPATGIQTRAAYITEVTAGTTPATPTFSVIPYVQFNLGMSRDIFSDPSIQADRQNHYIAFGNRKVAGEVDTILLAQTATTGNMLFDPWFESLLQGAWTTNVLKVGTTPKSFTIETTHLDPSLAASIYNRYVGCQVNQLQLTVNMGSVATCKWSFMGMDNTEATTAIASSTYTATPSTSAPLVHGNASNLFKEGGSASSIITSINMTIQQGLDANYALGSFGAASVTSSKIRVTGTVTAYFQDLTLLNKFLNGTTTSLEFKLSDGTRALDFLLPNVYYTGASHPITNDNPVVLTLPFEAIYDTGSSSAITITRS